MAIQDNVTYFPLLVICQKQGVDYLRLALFQILSQLSGIVEAVEPLARAYSRVNLQVSRFDRMFVLMTETFACVFALSFCFGTVVVLFAQKIASLVAAGNDMNANLMQLACLRGMFKAFRMAQAVSIADVKSHAIHFFLIFKYAVFAAQIAYFATQPASAEFLYAPIFNEVFCAAYDVVMYPLVLKIFARHRRHMAESQEAKEQQAELPNEVVDEDINKEIVELTARLSPHSKDPGSSKKE